VGGRAARDVGKAINGMGVKLNVGKTVDLDNPATYGALDRDDMLGKIREFPALCEKAWDVATKLSLPDGFAGVDKVVVLGMGGSAIGGDLVGSLALAQSRASVMVCRGYSLPSYVDARTLVVASSYSGNTEETLSCFEQSLKSGAKNLAMTTGGKLREMAEQHGVPVLTYNYRSPPRAALPFSFVPLLCVMGRLGLLEIAPVDIAEMVSALRRHQESIAENAPLASNQAKQIATDLRGRLAVIYGAETVSEVAHRWKTQINENSKAWAFHEVFPEMNHNAVVGYEFPADLNGRVLVVMLASSFLSERVQRRYAVVGRLLRKAGVEFRTVSGAGASRLSDMMSLVLFGDYVSYYLALLNGTDPSPVHAIDYLKEELARQPQA